MFHTAMVLKLRPGCLDEYRQAHDRIWPEIAQNMGEHEISMAIYHHRGALYIFAMAPSEAHWKRSREDPALDRWNRWMTEFLESNAAGGIDFEYPEQVFGFGVFSSGQPPEWPEFRSRKTG
jgi:L-rhamnose mutarotase